MDNKNHERLEAHRQRVIAGWRRLEVLGRAAGNKVLEAEARKQAELLEDPPVKLGDAFATLTHALGIPQCDDCKKRQAAMNKVDTRKGFVNTVKGIVKAIAS
jgi:hypothetical protein